MPEYYDLQPTDYSLNTYQAQPQQTQYGPEFNPNSSFWGSGQDSQPQQDYSLWGSQNPNYFSQSPSNATLQDMYSTPTLPSTNSGFGGTGLDPAVAGYNQQGDDQNQPWWKRMSMPNVSQGQADLFKGLASLYSAYQGNKQAGQLRQAAQMQDPFGSQRPQYQQLLSQSYSNPNAYMNTPEARLQQQALKQQLERADAKAGRRSQYGARAVDLQMAQAKQLADYRAGLQQAAGSQIQPGNSGALLQSASQAQVDANAAPFQALSSIFQKQTPQYQNTQAIIDKLLGGPKGG